MSEGFKLSEDQTRSERERYVLLRIEECGPKLAEENPSIYEDAMSGMTAEEIANKYNVVTTYTVTDIIAKKIVSRAILDLLSEEERRDRARKIMSATAKKTEFAQKGIFAQTPEKRANLGGGRASAGVSGNRYKGGEASRDQKKGVHALSKEEHRLNSAKGYENRTDAWFGGDIIDGMDEGTYALFLAKDPEYRHTLGKHIDTPDRTKILRAVNERYGNDRNTKAIHDFFRRHYKKYTTV